MKREITLNAICIQLLVYNFFIFRISAKKRIVYMNNKKNKLCNFLVVHIRICEMAKKRKKDEMCRKCKKKIF